MTKRPAFKNVHVLLAEPDARMARVIIQNLDALGFEQVSHSRSGKDALRIMRKHPVDLLITEWNMQPMNGLELVQALRFSEDSPNRTIPILMLTAKGEKPDVEAARDAGITEFVVKPFTARTLFTRIELIIEQPRAFVVSAVYTGPDRRRRGDSAAPGDRRTEKPKSVLPGSAAPPAEKSTLLIAPDYTLKRKVAGAQPLSALITPDVLNEAQQAINALRGESLQWIRDDLAALERTLARLAAAVDAPTLEAARDAALAIKSHAGMFGYTLAAEVAGMLHAFLCSDFIPSHRPHLGVAGKHLEVLKVVLAGSTAGEGGRIGREVVAELQALIRKFRGKGAATA